jgi:hypothetical protein
LGGVRQKILYSNTNNATNVLRGLELLTDKGQQKVLPVLIAESLLLCSSNNKLSTILVGVVLPHGLNACSIEGKNKRKGVSNNSPEINESYGKEAITCYIPARKT